jgi:hypothetical protein
LLESAGEVLRWRLLGLAMLPVIKAARFSDTTPGSEELAVRERVSAVREECHVDPQNQPRPNVVTIATATMQRGSMALSGATACTTTAFMLLIQPQASLSKCGKSAPGR